MNPADLISGTAVFITVAVMGVRFIMGMTRLVDSVDRLSRALEDVPAMVEDHEKRLTRAGL